MSCDCHVTSTTGCYAIHVCSLTVLSDLMLPGVVGVAEGGACYTSLQKGQVCAVNLLKNM